MSKVKLRARKAFPGAPMKRDFRTINRGEIFEALEDVAKEWIAGGYAVAVEEPKAAQEPEAIEPEKSDDGKKPAAKGGKNAAKDA